MTLPHNQATVFLLFAVQVLFYGSLVLASDCQQARVSVNTTDEHVRQEICAAAADTLAALQVFGLSPRRTITVDIVDDDIDSNGYLAYGSYDSKADRIRVMSYTAITGAGRKAEMYGEPFDREHYRGTIAHEVTHAIVQQNINERPRSTAGHEYLAHATQLTILSPQRRSAIIQAAGVGGWESGDVLSEIYMAMAPTRFAVKSYLHMASLDDPRSFAEIILNNKWFYVYIP